MNEPKSEDVMKALAWYEVVGKNIGSVTIPYDELQAIAALLREKDALIAKHEAYIDTLNEDKSCLVEQIEKKDAEIERLSHQCSECAGCTQWKCDCSNIRVEAITEFAERLKTFYKHLPGNTVGGAVEYHIDQIAKEMKEGKR